MLNGEQDDLIIYTNVFATVGRILSCLGAGTFELNCTCRQSLPGVLGSHKHNRVGGLPLADLLPLDDRLRHGSHT